MRDIRTEYQCAALFDPRAGEFEVLGNMAQRHPGWRVQSQGLVHHAVQIRQSLQIRCFGPAVAEDFTNLRRGAIPHPRPVSIP